MGLETEIQTQVKAVTLNCWGVPAVTKDRHARMQAIGEWLSTADYDFVFLEEVWLKSDYALIRKISEKNYPHGHYFYSGVIGSGTCILSRHQLTASLYHRSPVNGFAHMVHHGDWFGGKGVGFCQASCRGLTVNLYVTHLHANYNKARDVYSCHRLVQGFDCAQFVRLTSLGADLVIFGGDFNANPDELPYMVVTHCAGLQDAYYLDRNTKKELPEEATCESPRNSYRPAAPSLPHGERIDLLFVGTRGRCRITDVAYSQPLPDRVPGERFSYSDHEAVAVTLRISTDTHAGWSFPPCEARDSVLRESVAVCQTYLKSLHCDQLFHLVVSLLLLAALVGTLAVPSLHGWLQGLLRLLLTLLFGYTLFMATVWNRMERAGITAGLCDLRVALSRCTTAEPPPHCSRGDAEPPRQQLSPACRRAAACDAPDGDDDGGDDEGEVEKPTTNGAL